MSRIAKAPVDIKSGVEIKIAGQEVTVKGSKGTLTRVFNDAVEVVQEESQLKALPREGFANNWAQAGTARALLDQMVVGVTDGFEKKLQLNGVGYRAQAQGSKLNLTLGFSHPVVYEMPQGISVETPTQTEIVVKGTDKQVVGQVAANIRAYRPPEPYKGKGVRYADETVRRKEAKKK
ncbi:MULTISPECIES: 50S ribosomal protein L6 [Alteromonadaceae]|jgi:large subunit ribosomal protein L6|uniref:Large ribosomal subunit protein uL6 n=1 Tax=Brumicola blandensis TaxID=3075611 RepID=A0AAW8R3Z7_9ALTE|nr:MULTISPECIES: 50S ribosomal protein L6 [unclassified Alteromonas]MDT0582570.1 50S ribosomal protein L6 [Alteromonas sp. W409]MDT0628791.1 50S ribosomal protein L6 [Alteromonas sp. W364]|mmetsp:Transcript_7547/g.11203  ORF Transcript_7547/g.11203 Transcript_7547/m.11203 type:complete len:178 (-) Transcript_7547:313-846(-)